MTVIRKIAPIANNNVVSLAPVEKQLSDGNVGVVYEPAVTPSADYSEMSLGELIRAGVKLNEVPITPTLSTQSDINAIASSTLGAVTDLISDSSFEPVAPVEPVALNDSNQ